jgi:ATP-dependent Lon protease
MAVRQAPLLPLRDIVVFPHQVVPLFVGRERSIAALQHAMSNDKEILLAAQKRAKTNEPEPEDIFEFGTIATIVQLLHLPDGTVKVIVEGKHRAQIRAFDSIEPFFLTTIETIEKQEVDDVELEALIRSLRQTFESYAKLNKRVPPETIGAVTHIHPGSKLADTIAGFLTLKVIDKQDLLETINAKERFEKLLDLMQTEIEILQVEKKIRTRVKKQMEKTQKEYYLNEQMQAIQKELGERDEAKSDLQELEEKLAQKKFSEEAAARAETEIKRLKMMPPMSAEATVVRNYIDWMINLPWGEYTEDNKDIEIAEQVLDADHHGLEKVKDRILEHLAVTTLVDRMRGPILCLVGPPGVGKTSLAKSVARAMNREFVRMSLGGVRDEAEIRGHRRTYIGAMPGKIIQSLKRAGTSNPVFLLDEVDKMSTDFRGDPSSALLEVLDPEQNSTFCDHFMDLDYDLSRVMFIATANDMSGIPPALMDRMEIIRLSGYTEIEKLAIARKYLVAKQIEANGLSDFNISYTDDALKMIIQRYTREAGVRSLEREIASVARKIAREVLKKGEKTKKSKIRVTEKRIPKFLGVFKHRHGHQEETDQIGIATGLAWTQVGGEILTIEAATMMGTGKLIITGKLGDVMQESARAAMSYVRSRAKLLGLDPSFYSKMDIHIHVPEGAMPKDGPSAGITMATAIVSALTHIPVHRNVAMTGEITLRGRVLPIGGLKEKTLAAHRAGISHVLFPKENEKDIPELPKLIKDNITMIPVDTVDDVLKYTLAVDDREKFYERLQGSEGFDDEAESIISEEQSHSNNASAL